MTNSEFQIVCDAHSMIAGKMLATLEAIVSKGIYRLVCADVSTEYAHGRHFGYDYALQISLAPDADVPDYVHGVGVAETVAHSREAKFSRARVDEAIEQFHRLVTAWESGEKMDPVLKIEAGFAEGDGA